jgi:putative DNA primase/helicase
MDISMGKTNVSLTAPADLPAELVRLKQWVAWKYITKKNSTKPAKMPLQASGEEAKTNDPTTWTTFSGICSKVAEANGHFDGIGFVFSEKDQYAGVDLDNCLNPDGTVRDWAEPLLARFADTYAEMSPSGSGIKAWCRAKLGQGRKIEFYVASIKCAVEAYSQGRFFSVTGQRWLNAPLEIRPHQADVARRTNRHGTD